MSNMTTGNCAIAPTQPLSQQICKENEMDIPQEVLDEIENTVIDMEFDYRDRLSDDHVDMILAPPEHGGSPSNDILMQLWENNIDYVSQLEWDTAEYILAEHGHDVDMHDFFDQYGVFPSVDLNIDRLISNTQPYIGLEIKPIDHYVDSSYHYADVEDVLDFFNINPRSLEEWINITDAPDLPDRNGNEYVKPLQLAEAWINCFYSGSYIALLGTDALETLAKHPKEVYVNGITLFKGTEITIHDYMNGSSSTEVVLLRDLRLEPGEFDFFNDGKNKYGIQSCCGLPYGAWDSGFEINSGPVKEA